MIYLVSNQTNAFNNEFNQISLLEGIEIVSKLKFIGADTETEGLDCFTKKLLTVQLGNKEIQVVFDITSYGGKIPSPLKNFMNTFDGTFILQNAKFDLKFMYLQDVFVKNIYDTMLVETILTIGLQMSGRDLHTLAEKYCGVDLDKSIRGQIITKGLNAAVIRYAAYDVVYLEEIMVKQMKQVKYLKLDNAVKLDNEFVKVLAYIEFCGIKLDWNKWKEKSKRDLEAVYESKKKLDNWLFERGMMKYFNGIPDLFTGEMECILNWNSSKQVIELFESLGIDCTIVDKGVKKKTVEEKAIGKYKDEFPLLKLYFDFKAATKLTSTYGLSWEKMINPVTGRIHTTFQQLMNTGRLSCGNARENKPNLQNLPSDKLTRSCFVAEPGNKYIAVDYCAQESIILANFSKDRNLLGFYEKGFEDMHSYVTFLLFPELRRCEIDDLTNDELIWIKKNHKHERNVAKTAEFAIAYGGNGSTIAKNTGQSKSQGEFVYNSYFEAFCDLKNYFDAGMRQVQRDHYILFNNLTGRKLFFSPEEPFLKYQEDINDPCFRQFPNCREIEREYNKSFSEAQRKSQNYRIQGSAADCSKLAGVILFKELQRRNLLNVVKIVNFVHDEFNIECPEQMANEISDLVVKCMEKAGSQFCKVVPLTADPEIGDYWIH